jgi:hypothetical protein
MYTDLDTQADLISSNLIESSMNPKRTEKSLGMLTQKFVDLLQSTKGGIVDLKRAALKLEVRQKRRLYDITNVLEGIGLIRKCGKNFVQWRGGKLYRRSPDGTVDLNSSFDMESKSFNDDIALLKTESEQLDALVSMTQLSVKNIAEDEEFRKFCFVTALNMQEEYGANDDTIIGVQSDYETDVQILQPDVRHKLSLKCEDGPINVFLLNNEEHERMDTGEDEPESLNDSTDSLEKLINDINDDTENVKPVDHPKEPPVDTNDAVENLEIEDPKAAKAILGDLRCRNMCELLNAHFKPPKAGTNGPEAAHLNPVSPALSVSFDFPYLRDLDSPSIFYNLLMSEHEGSRNLFDIDLLDYDPDAETDENGRNGSESSDMTKNADSNNKSFRQMPATRRAPVED